MKKSLLLFALIFMGESIMAQGQFNCLVFSKTEGFRHESILEGVQAIRVLGDQHDFNVTWKEEATIFNDQELAKYKVIVFLNTSGDIFNEDQQNAFKKFIQNGGGFVGIHGPTVTEYNWEWYGKLIGRYFKIHPVVQTAVLKVIDKNHPSTYHLPDKWLWTDEWYDFHEPLVNDLTDILLVDESTYNPEAKWENAESKGMGDYHPIAWYHEYDGGRAFYTALGHIRASYSDPLFLQHIYGAIYWAANLNK